MAGKKSYWLSSAAAAANQPWQHLEPFFIPAGAQQAVAVDAAVGRRSLLSRETAALGNSSDIVGLPFFPPRLGLVMGVA